MIRDRLNKNLILIWYRHNLIHLDWIIKHLMVLNFKQIYLIKVNILLSWYQLTNFIFKGFDRLILNLYLIDVTSSFKIKLNWNLNSLPKELKLNGYRLFYLRNGTNETIESNGNLFTKMVLSYK
jgi:hypothetical protein